MADIEGIVELVTALDLAAAEVGVKTRGVVEKGALNIKRDWQQRASGLRHAPLYPASITYDLAVKGFGIEAEVGPDKDRPQGALGNLITFGSANNAPSGDDVAVLSTEAPKFVKAMTDLADGLL